MALQGYKGKVSVGAVEVLTAKIWSLDMSAAETDATTFADAGWSSVCAGLKTWGGSITVVWDAGGDPGEDLLIQSFIAGTEIALELTTAESLSATATAEVFTGNAVITSMPVTNDVASCVEVTFAFSGRGALTIAAALP